MLLKRALLFAFALAACSERRAPEAAAQPELTCSAPRRDFGRVLEGQRLLHAFRLENRSSTPLVVHGVDGGYACKAAAVPPGVAARDGATLEVACETTGHPARLLERLTVRSNASPLELELAAEVEPLLAFETTLVELRTRFGAPLERKIGLTGPLLSRAELRVVEVTLAGVEVTVVDGEKALELRSPASEVGVGAGHVRVATGLEHPKELTLPYSFEVKGNLTIEPERPYVNLRLPGPKQVAFSVTSTRDDFVLRSVEVSEGPFEARFERRAARVYEVQARVRDDAMPDDRGFSGELVLASNDPSEPRKVVPLFALGVPNPD